MTKLTIVGDLHAKNDNLDKQARIFDQIEALGNTTVLLGDIFHTKEVIRGKCLNFVFDRLQNSKLRFYILVGNHDLFNLDSQEHALEIFKSLPNCTVVDSPQSTLAISHYLEADSSAHVASTITLGFIPYIHDLQKLRETISCLDCDVLFGHFAVSNFDYGNGHLATNELELTDFNRFKKVISGHIHKRQEEGSLLFLGTPFSHDFGESNQEKFIGVLNLEDLSFEFIPTGLPQHQTLEIDFEFTGPEPILHLSETDPTRVVLKGTEEQIAAFDKDKYPNVKFIEQPINTDSTKFAISELNSRIANFKKWAVEVKGLDPETVELGLSFLEEADV